MTDGHDDSATEGKAAVRQHFVQRLQDAGVERPKGMSAAGYDAMMGGLVEWLSYMRLENLKTLAEQMLDAAVDAKGKCPSEVVIRQAAKNLQKPPPFESRIYTSWLHSIEGPPALAGGYLVELFQFLRNRKTNLAPAEFEMREVRAKAEWWRREREMIRGRTERGTDTPEDRRLMSEWLADEQIALEIVQAGIAHRAAKQKGTEG